MRVIPNSLTKRISETPKELLDIIEREVKIYKTLKSNTVKAMFVFTDKKLTVDLYAEYFI